MESKDYIAIAALIVSLCSLGLTLWQRYVEMRRSVHTQLTALMIEIAKALAASSSNVNEERASAGHRLVVLTRQAVFLLKTEPKLAQDTDYLTLAEGLWRTGDDTATEEYWRNCIKLANDQSLRLISRARFGEFLGERGRNKEMNEQFETALGLVQRTSDANKAQVVTIYINWMEAEKQYGSASAALRHYESAKEVAGQIGNSVFRVNTTNNIERRRAAAFAEPPVVIDEVAMVVPNTNQSNPSQP